MGCNKKEELDKGEIEIIASNLAREYVKVKYNKDFIVEEIQWPEVPNRTTLFIHGHYKGNSNKEVNVLVDYEDKFKIMGMTETRHSKTMEKPPVATFTPGVSF